MSKRVDCLIIGGGPTGLTAAPYVETDCFSSIALLGVDDPIKHLFGVGWLSHALRLVIWAVRKRRIFPSLLFEQSDDLGDLPLAHRGELQRQLSPSTRGQIIAALGRQD